MKDTARIGFVGVGRMGANMARRLYDERYRVVAVHDCNAARAQTLASELGCAHVSTPAAVAAESTIVFTVITDDAAMREIYAEQCPDSLLVHAEGRLFINCATLSPEIHREMERLIESRGGASLEACMASSIPQARHGTLYLMCGGRPDAFEQAQPLLRSLSASLRYIGPTGTAATVKALVNMVMNINTAGLAEGLGLGHALGLDVAMLREVFAQTGAASRVLETDGEDMQLRAHECFFSAAHAAKDCGIALDLARRAQVPVPLAQATYGQYRKLIDLGKGDLDKSAVAELTFKGRGS